MNAVQPYEVSLEEHKTPVEPPPLNNLYIRTVMFVGGVNELIGAADPFGRIMLQSPMMSKRIEQLKHVPRIMHLSLWLAGNRDCAYVVLDNGGFSCKPSGTFHGQSLSIR